MKNRQHIGFACSSNTGSLLNVMVSKEVHKFGVSIKHARSNVLLHAAFRVTSV